MYEMLSTRELAVLTRWLFEGTEQAYLAACGAADAADWAEHRWPVHAELAEEFLIAGTELLVRVDQYWPRIA